MTTTKVKNEDCCISVGSPEEGLVCGSEEGVLPGEGGIDERVKSRSRLCSPFSSILSTTSLMWMLLIFTSCCIILMSSSSLSSLAPAVRTTRSPQQQTHHPSQSPPAFSSSATSPPLRSANLNDQNEINNETEDPGPVPVKVEKPANNTPVILSIGQEIVARENDSVSFPCEVKDLGEFVVLWRKEMSRILYAGTLQVWKDARIRLSNNNANGNFNLHLNGVKEDDAGEYVCMISYPGTTPVLVTHHLRVLVPPTIDQTPKHPRLAVRKGEEVVLGCKAKGIPPPSVRWRKNRIEYGRDSWSDAGEGTNLTIWNVTRKDTGSYVCTATNEVGESTVTFKVDVLYPPEVEVDNRIIHTGVGIDETLTCRVYAEPPADVIWTRERDSKQIPNSTDKFITHRDSQGEATLKILNVNQEDFDNYTCLASNTYGVQSERIELVAFPSTARIKSRDNLWLHSDHAYYDLSWEVASYTAVTKYQVRYRRVQMNETEEEIHWNTIGPIDIERSRQVTFDRQDRNFVYQGEARIHPIDWETVYEVQVEVENAFGWSRPNEAFHFTVFSAPPGYSGSSSSLSSPVNGILAFLTSLLILIHSSFSR